MSQSRSIIRFLFRSFFIVLFASLVAVGVNAGRPDSLAWIASSEYEIYDECPEGEEEAPAIAIDELLENPDYFLLVDSRMPGEFDEGHVDGALSVPYDPLFSVTEEDVVRVRETAGDRTVVVIGDSLTARLLANDFLSQGLDWVHYLEGDAAWRTLLGDGD